MCNYSDVSQLMLRDLLTLLVPLCVGDVMCMHYDVVCSKDMYHLLCRISLMYCCVCVCARACMCVSARMCMYVCVCVSVCLSVCMHVSAYA